MRPTDRTRAAYDAVAAAYAALLPGIAEPPLELALLEHLARQAGGPVIGLAALDGTRRPAGRRDGMLVSLRLPRPARGTRRAADPTGRYI